MKCIVLTPNAACKASFNVSSIALSPSTFRLLRRYFPKTKGENDKRPSPVRGGGAEEGFYPALPKVLRKVI
jgi:hypothetical protein